MSIHWLDDSPRVHLLGKRDDPTLCVKILYVEKEKAFFMKMFVRQAFFHSKSGGASQNKNAYWYLSGTVSSKFQTILFNVSGNISCEDINLINNNCKTDKFWWRHHVYTHRGHGAVFQDCLLKYLKFILLRISDLGHLKFLLFE